MYAQAGQSTASDIAQLESVEVIGRRTLWDRFVGGVINNSHGTASSAGSIANSLYYAAVPGAATMNSAVNYWQAGRYGWAALYGTASFGEAAASILTFGQGQTLMAGMRGAQSASRGLAHLGASSVTTGEQVTESVVRNAMKNAPLTSQQAGGISLPRVQRYVDKLLKGEVAPAIKVDKNLIVDGNHRYVAGRILGQEPAIQPWMGGRPDNAVPWDKLPISPESW